MSIYPFLKNVSDFICWLVDILANLTYTLIFIFHFRILSWSELWECCFLFLDRDGVKSIVEAETLMSMQYCVNKYFIDEAKELEEDLLEFLKCSINKPFVEEKERHLKMHTMFDAIFGTSAGALVATALTPMNFSPEMMINEVFEISQLMFPQHNFIVKWFNCLMDNWLLCWMEKHMLSRE